MSRCYPYPPPGYEKKAPILDLGPSIKERKHKDKNKDKNIDKDKKKKRKKDTKSVASEIRDKDKELNKVHRNELANDAVHSRNGILSETSFAVVAANLEDEVRGDDNELHLDSTVRQPVLYSSEQEANGKVNSCSPLVVSRLAGTTTSSDVVHANFHKSGPESEILALGHSSSVPQIECDWSTYDNQEWLFPTSKHVNIKPKVEVEESVESPHVWAEILHLPSIDTYALPFVIPY